MKNGETYNGTLANCDTWMNVHLREVICTAKDGDRFWRVPEVYLRGSMIKYLQVPDAALDKAEQEEQALRRDDRRALGGRGRGRGGGGTRGRGRGRGRGGGGGGGPHRGGGHGGHHRGGGRPEPMPEWA